MKMRTIGMAVAGLMLAAATSGAAEPKGWKVEVMPYAWLAGIDGDVTVNGHEADFDKSFSDLVDAVELGGSLFTTIQYDRFLLWGQVDYFKMSTDELDKDDQPERGSLDTSMVLGELAVGYQIDGWMKGQTFDLLVGARYLRLKSDLDLDDGRSASRENDIWDPIFVVRPVIPMFPSKVDGLKFSPTLAIGGGGDSDRVYELYPKIEYQINDRWATAFGYRTVGYKFKGDDNEDNELNIELSGLTLGLGVTF